MKIKEFKQRLSKLNVSFKKIESRFKQYYKPDRAYGLYPGHHYHTIDQLIEDRLDFHDIVCRAFVWEKTPEGHDFWVAVAEEYIVLAKEDTIIDDYDIVVYPKNGKSLWVGCKEITTTKQKSYLSCWQNN